MGTKIMPGGMIAVKHQWPSSPSYSDGQQGFYNLDTFLTINQAPEISYYFWAQQFWFIGGDGGYMGLQTGGNINGQVCKIAIFSIWMAIDAKPGNAVNSVAEPFDGEGTGYSCKIEYDWNEDTEYRLRLWEVGDAREPDNAEWWGAWIMNMATMEETFIGQIQVPANWKWMTSNTNFFVEYFLETDGCAGVPYAKATLHGPTRENATVKPTTQPVLEVYGICMSVARATLGPDGSTVYAETGSPMPAPSS